MARRVANGIAACFIQRLRRAAGASNSLIPLGGSGALLGGSPRIHIGEGALGCCAASGFYLLPTLVSLYRRIASWTSFLAERFSLSARKRDAPSMISLSRP